MPGSNGRLDAGGRQSFKQYVETYYLHNQTIQVLTEWWSFRPDPSACQDPDDPSVFLTQRILCPASGEQVWPMESPPTHLSSDELRGAEG